MPEDRRYQFFPWCIQTRTVCLAIVLFFQLLKMLKSNIIVECVQISKVIPVRHCTFIYDRQCKKCAGAFASLPVRKSHHFALAFGGLLDSQQGQIS